MGATSALSALNVKIYEYLDNKIPPLKHGPRERRITKTKAPVLARRISLTASSSMGREWKLSPAPKPKRRLKFPPFGSFSVFWNVMEWNSSRVTRSVDCV